MSESDYWQRLQRRRLSRRAFLGATALSAGGLAAAGVVGCGGGDNNGGNTPASGGSGRAGLYAGPIDARQPFVPAPSGMSGGTLRYQGFDPVVLDRYDPHQTQFGPMYANQSAVFSRLYMYKSKEEPTWENIVPDIAETAPEMIGPSGAPDTYIVKLRRGVKFHDNEKVRGNFPTLAGRELTADDVLYSYNRQRNKDSPQRGYYYRSSQYDTIDTIEKTDDYTIRITTKGPVAPFYHFMADTNAFIVPHEVVDQASDTVDATSGPRPEERMVGSGPFMWDKLTFGIEFKAVRNPAWFGWDDPTLARPYLAAYDVSGSALDDSSIESLFRRKQIDFASFIDNPQWLFSIKDEIPELVLFESWISGWVNTRLKVNCVPFDDWRVRKALHLAADRQQVIDVIGAGEWKLQGPVGGAVAYWALPYEDLQKLPGYRTGKSDRDKDIADARAAYEAAGSPELPPVWFADIPSYIPAFAPTYISTIKQNLGATVYSQIQAYSRIYEAYTRGCDQATITWGFDNGWVDLDDWVYPYFHTKGPKNSFGVSDTQLDSMLEAQRREFDIEKRRSLGYDIQRYLLGAPKEDSPAAYCRLDYAAPYLAWVYWPYVKNWSNFPWFGDSQWNANVWLDKNDPMYSGRQG